jgi:diaminopimelate epimerase
MDKNAFIKSHGLGNDYIVLDSANISFQLSQTAIHKICDVHYGIGSDGILLKTPSNKADFGMKIYNPDGSEAEKSGNGLRIFSKFLYDHGYTHQKEFSIETLSGIVKAKIIEELKGKAKTIEIEMGKAIFKSNEIPVNIDKEECINEKINIADKEFLINCVSVGNPHCVILTDKPDVKEVMKYGPLIENHSLFPNKINVQFVKKISDTEVEILIWERGAGYTLASGTSSCAVACIMYKKGITGNNISIKMPGGSLFIRINSNWEITMTGEVRQIAQGYLNNELIEDIL